MTDAEKEIQWVGQRRLVRDVMMSSWELFSAGVDEVFEPAFGDGGRDVGFLVVVFDGLSPVEADITIGEAAGSIDEYGQLFDAAMQREHLFYDERFSYIVGGKGCEGLIDLAFFGIEVDGGEIQVFRDFVRIKERLCFWEGMYPGDYTYGYHVSVVVLSDSCNELVDPCFSDLLAGAAFKVECDALNEVLSCELAGEPVGLLFVCTGQDGLVHKVVTKDCRAFGTGFCDRFPEEGLRIPTLCLIHLVVPLGDVLFVVTAEACDVEVNAGLLGQFVEARELSKGCFIRLSR